MTTDDPRHPHPDRPGAGAPASRDELASALLDGELTADEAVEARRRPDVAARVAEMEAARAALGAVPTSDPTGREQAIAAALAAFDAESAHPTGSVPPVRAASTGMPTDTGVAPHDPGAVARLGLHRRAKGRGVSRWLGAAAAAAVLVGAAGLAIATRDGSGGGTADTEASEAERSPSAGSGGGDSSGTAEAPTPDAEAGGSADEGAVAEVGDLGTYPSADALTEQVTSLVEGGAEDMRLTPESPAQPQAADATASADALVALASTCPTGLPAPLDDPTVVLRLHARAVVDDRPVDLWVVDGDDGDRLVAVDASCAVVVDRPLG